MLILPTRITHETARVCTHMLTQALADTGSALGETRVVADASPLQHFDSSALAVLLECRRQAQRRGQHFSVRDLPMRLRALAVLYGIDQLLPDAR